jgi:uncharacterized RDD family membrane protein YckC
MSFDEDSVPLRSGSFHEGHRVETPEQTQIEFTLAGIGSRALALIYDTLIQAGIFLIAALFLGLVASFPDVHLARVWGAAVLIVAAFLLYYGYFALFEIFRNGQTPGKRKLRIRVIKDTGRRLTAVESIARNLLRIVDQLPGFYAVGIAVSLLNKQNKRIGDFVAGAIVVREQSASISTLDWAHGPEKLPLRAPLGAANLTDEEVLLIESFLQRRWELEGGIRWRLANEIFQRVAGKLTVSPEDRAGVEHLLEAAVHERRAAAYGPTRSDSRSPTNPL